MGRLQKIVASALIGLAVSITAGIFVVTSSLPAHGVVEKKPPKLKRKEQVLKLLLSTFIAAGNLEEARKVAELGTNYFPASRYWWQKYAEVNMWTGKPDEALRAYIVLYRLSGNDDVRKMATELAVVLNRFDVAKELMEKDIKEGRLRDVNKIIQIYEMSGDIDELIPLLEGMYARDRDKQTLFALARLYFFYGRPEDALKTLERMEQNHGLTIDEVLFYSNVLYSMRRYRDALKLLKRYRAEATPEDRLFWETLSDLAWGLKDYPTSVEASRTLYEAGTPRQIDHERLFLWLADKGDERIIEYALDGWKRFRTRYLFYYFLNAATSYKKWHLIVDEVEGLPIEDRIYFMKDRSFMEIYAYALARTGRVELARKLYRELLKESFSKSLLANYIYFLLDIEDGKGLREVVRTYSMVEADRELIVPFIFAYVRLQNGKRALKLARLMEIDSVDKEVLYMEILSLYGRTYSAESMRYRLYVRLKRMLQKEPSLIKNRVFFENFLFLAMYYEPAQKIKDYIKEGRGVVSRPMLEDLELSHLLMRQEHNRVDYLIRIHGYYARPWMHLNIALWKDERMKMLRLLEDNLYGLPIRDRVEALVRVGSIGLALDYSYRGLEDNPEDSLLYTQMADIVSEYAQRAELRAEHISYGPYEEFKKSASAGIYINNGVSVELFGSVADRAGSDNTILVNAPSARREAGIKIKGLLKRGRVGLTVGSMKGTHTNQYYLVELESYYLEHKIRLGLAYGENLFTDDNIYLYLGGMRDSRSATVFYSHSNKLTFGFELAKHRYFSQDGKRLGDGTTIRQVAYYSLREGYPDYTLRAYAESQQFREDRQQGASIERLYPVAPTRVLNRSYKLVGAGLFFGNRNLNGYVRVWRPFLSFDVTWNNLTDIGFDISGGVGGGLLRQDNLSVGARYVKGFKSTEDEYLNLFMQYRLFYY